MVISTRPPRLPSTAAQRQMTCPSNFFEALRHGVLQHKINRNVYLCTDLTGSGLTMQINL